MHFNNVFQTIKKSNVNFHGLKDSGWVVPNFFLKISFVVSINYFGVGGWVDLTKMNRFQLFYYYFALLSFFKHLIICVRAQGREREIAKAGCLHRPNLCQNKTNDGQTVLYC